MPYFVHLTAGSGGGPPSPLDEAMSDSNFKVPAKVLSQSHRSPDVPFISIGMSKSGEPEISSRGQPNFLTPPKTLDYMLSSLPHIFTGFVYGLG